MAILISTLQTKTIELLNILFTTTEALIKLLAIH